MWKTISERPEGDGYCWVTLKSGGVELAYYSTFNQEFIAAETVGDAEGLNTEYYSDVIAWDYLIYPEPAIIDPALTPML